MLSPVEAFLGFFNRIILRRVQGKSFGSDPNYN
jgi:hypothetical protein